jgi:hypothetical protein
MKRVGSLLAIGRSSSQSSGAFSSGDLLVSSAIQSHAAQAPDTPAALTMSTLPVAGMDAAEKDAKIAALEQELAKLRTQLHAFHISAPPSLPSVDHSDAFLSPDNRTGNTSSISDYAMQLQSPAFAPGNANNSKTFSANVNMEASRERPPLCPEGSISAAQVRNAVPSILLTGIVPATYSPMVGSPSEAGYTNREQLAGVQGTEEKANTWGARDSGCSSLPQLSSSYRSDSGRRPDNVRIPAQSPFFGDPSAHVSLLPSPAVMLGDDGIDVVDATPVTIGSPLWVQGRNITPISPEEDDFSGLLSPDPRTQ